MKHLKSSSQALFLTVLLVTFLIIGCASPSNETFRSNWQDGIYTLEEDSSVSVILYHNSLYGGASVFSGISELTLFLFDTSLLDVVDTLTSEVTSYNSFDDEPHFMEEHGFLNQYISLDDTIMNNLYLTIDTLGVRLEAQNTLTRAITNYNLHKTGTLHRILPSIATYATTINNEAVTFSISEVDSTYYFSCTITTADSTEYKAVLFRLSQTTYLEPNSLSLTYDLIGGYFGDRDFKGIYDFNGVIYTDISLITDSVGVHLLGYNCNDKSEESFLLQIQ